MSHFLSYILDGHRDIHNFSSLNVRAYVLQERIVQLAHAMVYYLKSPPRLSNPSNHDPLITLRSVMYLLQFSFPTKEPENEM